MALWHQKWDAQVGDVAALASFPLVLTRGTWEELAALAVALANETHAVERELTGRADLHARLGLPPSLAAVLRAPGTQAPPAAGRIVRFDFHPTTDGWRVSEVNSDVPGGFTESSRFTELMAARCGDGDAVGDAAATWVTSTSDLIPARGTVALLSAPGWVEDLQVVAHLASRLRARGLTAHLASVQQLQWIGGRAHLGNGPVAVPLDGIVRFYQAEWLSRLACRSSWEPLFCGGQTPVSNPGSAALTESKRMPLVWSELDAPTPTWRRVLPETRDPREASRFWQGDWILKPTFGNTGDGVTVRDRLSRVEWYSRVAAAIVRPARWVAQRRFESVAVESPSGAVHVCIGVYVVDGAVAGAYGRLSPSVLIDYAAIDAAVLVEP
jgi:glutathionylspermidine synthase